MIRDYDQGSRLEDQGLEFGKYIDYVYVVTDCTSMDQRYWSGSRSLGTARHMLRLARAYREDGFPAEAARYLNLAAVMRERGRL